MADCVVTETKMKQQNLDSVCDQQDNVGRPTNNETPDDDDVCSTKQCGLKTASSPIGPNIIVEQHKKIFILLQQAPSIVASTITHHMFTSIQQ